MFTRRSLPLLLGLAVVLGGVGFLAGMWVQAYRMAGDAAGDGSNQTPVRPIAQLSPTGRIVGGFEHQEAMLLGVNGLLRIDPEVLVQIVTAIHDRIKLIGVVNNAEQRTQAVELLKQRGLPASSIRFFQWPVEST